MIRFKKNYRLCHTFSCSLENWTTKTMCCKIKYRKHILWITVSNRKVFLIDIHLPQRCKVFGQVEKKTRFQTTKQNPCEILQNSSLMEHWQTLPESFLSTSFEFIFAFHFHFHSCHWSAKHIYGYRFGDWWWVRSFLWSELLFFLRTTPLHRKNYPNCDWWNDQRFSIQKSKMCFLQFIRCLINI